MPCSLFAIVVMRTFKNSRAQRVERYYISTNPFTGGYERRNLFSLEVSVYGEKNMIKWPSFVIYLNTTLHLCQAFFLNYFLIFNHNRHHDNKKSCQYYCSWKYCHEHLKNINYIHNIPAYAVVDNPYNVTKTIDQENILGIYLIDGGCLYTWITSAYDSTCFIVVLVILQWYPLLKRI